MGLMGTAPLAGCHRAQPAEAASTRRSLEGLEVELGRLATGFSALRRQVETIPPDLPGFRELRAKFYAIEEARGITDAKVKLLADRLDSAARAGDLHQLRQIAKEIAETHDEIRQIDELHSSLQRRVRAFQATAGQGEVEAVTSARP